MHLPEKLHLLSRPLRLVALVSFHLIPHAVRSPVAAPAYGWAIKAADLDSEFSQHGSHSIRDDVVSLLGQVCGIPGVDIGGQGRLDAP